MNSTWSAFAAWLLHSAVGGGLLLLLAWPLTRLCRQPAWRQRLGESALLAALLLCALNLGPSWITLPVLDPELSPLPMPAAPTLSPDLTSALAAELDRADPFLFDNASGTFATPGANTGLAGLDPTSRGPAQPIVLPELPGKDTAPGIASRLASVARSRWLLGIVLAYAVVSVCLLGRWLLGHFVLWRLLRVARPAPETVNQMFETMTGRQRRRPRLLVSRRLSVPLSCGLIRPCVIVPASLCAPNAVRTLRWVFAHELTHTGRGDAWACLLFGLGQALYFCFPWFWWLRRQVRLCQEHIADAAAAEQAGEPEDYAQFLVSLTRAPALPFGTLGVFGNSSDLLRRVTMLVQSPIRVEQRCPRWWSLATAGSLLGLALLVSGISLRADDVPAPADQEAVTAATDQQETAQAPREVEQAEPAESGSQRLKAVPDPKPAVEPVNEKKIQLKARSTPWPVALEWLANQADMGISASMKPEGNFEYIQPKGSKQFFTIPEVVDIMNAQLMTLTKPCILIRGPREFSLISLPNNRGGQRMDPSKLPRVTSDELDQHGETELVSLEYHLDVLLADAIEKELRSKNILSPYGEAMALPGSNQLVLRDTVQNLRNIIHFLRMAEDAEKKRGSGFSYRCEYIKASNAEKTLKDLLGIPAAAAPTSDGVRPNPQPSVPNPPTGAAPHKNVYVSHDDISNKVFVTGPPPKLEIARKILMDADVPPQGEDKIESGPPSLKSLLVPGGNAQEVAKALKEKYKQSHITIAAIGKEQLMIWAPPADQAAIAQYVANYMKQVNTEVILLNNLGANKTLDLLKSLFDSKGGAPVPNLAADPARNAIIVKGTRVQIKAVEDTLAELGEKRAPRPFGEDLTPSKAGRLGIQVQKPEPALADQLDLPKGVGLLIEHIVPGSPAAKGGVRAHDILLELDGKTVPDNLADAVKMPEQGIANNAVLVTVLRKGKKLQLRVPLSSSLPNARPPVPGGSANRAVITTLLRTKDGFSTRYQEGRLLITVTGSVTDSKSTVSQIRIQDAGKSETYESVDQVPAQYRDKVKNLIEMSEQNNRKIELGADFEVIRLKYAKATDAARILDEALNGTKKNQNASDDWFFGPRRPPKQPENAVRVVADPNTNSLLVKATPLDMVMIRNMVNEYIDKPAVGAKAGMKTWKLGPFKHAKAADIYYLIKDLYREHLNNQINNPANAPPRGVALTVTYDSTTNTVYVQCNEPMYKEIKHVVEEYDKDLKDSRSPSAPLIKPPSKDRDITPILPDRGTQRE